jgi:hypothetical protein
MDSAYPHKDTDFSKLRREFRGNPPRLFRHGQNESR